MMRCACGRLGLSSNARRLDSMAAPQSNSRLRATAALARCASARSGSSARAARASVSARPAQRSTSSGGANRRYSSAQAMASPARASAYSGSTRRAVSNASTAARVPAGVYCTSAARPARYDRVGRGVARITPPQPFLFRGRQLEAQRSGDALGDDRLGVVELVGPHAHAIRPDDPVRRGVLEPRRHGDVATVDDDVAVEHQRVRRATFAASLGADDQQPLSAEPGGDGVGEAEARGAVVAAADKGTDDERRARDRRPADGRIATPGRRPAPGGRRRPSPSAASGWPADADGDTGLGGGGSAACPGGDAGVGGLRRGSVALRRKGSDRRDESIAAPRQRLDEARRFGDVAQRGAQLPHRVVDALFEVDERVVSPQRPLQVVAGDQVVGPGQQQGQQLQRLRPYRDQPSGLAQLERASVEVEDPEPVTLERTGAV